MMKKRIRKTGEIVDVINYSAPNLGREKNDYVSYIDSKGVEHVAEHGLNIHWDFEDVEEKLAKEIDWEERRYHIAKDVIHAQITAPIIPGVDPNPSITDLVERSVLIADVLIAELKKGGEK